MTLALDAGDVIMSGQLLLALPLAVLAGLVSFASPCVLPVVPGYLGLVGATSRSRTESGRLETAQADAGTTTTRLGPKTRVALGATLFVIGFSVVYVVAGAAFGQMGQWLLASQGTIMRVLGVVVFLMGLVFVGQVSFMQRQWKPLRSQAGLLAAPLLGVAFGVGWVPCIGPTLIAIQALSFQSASPGRGALLGFAYCIGLGIPFILLALGFGAATTGADWLRRHIRAINLAGGALLMLIGLLMVFGVWQQFVSVVGSILPGYVAPI
ncbi:cytochrome c biogenesis protein CcdA [Pseudoclavibacter chungangensis]|uniref:Cytochrome c biogenesis protein CcdA n=1 Tax=Pseudoclavibacter chungangensis TaxID=587635 RepID=A0A7J5BQ61_9MICO|nr:cytochrome c biogenesis protein CcdA [Pseudoclavibacter chungangensis]KAB1655672.1 cytochrome c biogenesis protein CcdA [Pseudoclavibacter chungangensis]NYJ67918.1 cytochrome c-type biogenesis protein [Pseudoclavibacter chungangensis]